MAKKFGTGKIKSDSSTTRKWVKSIHEQTSPSSAINVQNIPLSEIQLDPNNPRKLSCNRRFIELFIDEHGSILSFENNLEDTVSRFCNTNSTHNILQDEFLKLCQFAISLRGSQNLINPILVQRKNNSFQVIAGERRFLAHLLLTEKTIQAKVTEQENLKDESFERVLLQWQENQLREDLHLTDQINNLRRLLTAWESNNGDKITVRKFASLTGFSKTIAGNYLKIINNSNKLFVDLINSREVSALRTLYNLSGLNVKELKEFLNSNNSSNKKSSSNSVSSFKITANQKKMGTLINIISESINKDSLTKDLESLDLNNKNNINKALKMILDNL